MLIHRIEIIDTHTGGEPTRVVVSGGPDLQGTTLAERRACFRDRFDHFRRAINCEPRGSDVMVGALLCPPVNKSCVAGVIFFNNVGYLGMCGHGTIGVGVALGHLGRIAAGRHILETPVGQVPFEYDGEHTVALENVASYRVAADVRLTVTGLGEITGDIAWGGNWFFLARDHGQVLELHNVPRLTELTLRIKDALRQQGITGENGAEIDHVELFGPPRNPLNSSRNFVLCPGGAYDRSPCGTGTSAKVACLAAEGTLLPGEIWRQESILGSVFEASFRPLETAVLPRISGQAHVTAEGFLLVDDRDPLAWGVSS
jgi:4-hydroxyproline epimerase